MSGSFQSPERVDRSSNLIGWIHELPDRVNLQPAISCYVYLNIFNSTAYFWAVSQPPVYSLVFKRRGPPQIK